MCWHSHLGANINHIASCNSRESCDCNLPFCRKHSSYVCQDFETCLVSQEIHMRVPFLEQEGFSTTVSFIPCVTVATLCWVFGNQQSLVFSRLMRIHCCGSSLFHVFSWQYSHVSVTEAVLQHSVVLHQVCCTSLHFLKQNRTFLSIRI